MDGRALLAALALATAARADVLEAGIERADRDAARAFHRLAERADRDGQRATAVRLWRRALAVRPDDPTARARLGFRRRAGTWQRSERNAVDRRARADADRHAWPRWRDRADAVEAARADAILVACREAGMPDRCAEILRTLVERVPRHAGVHEALGHVRIDGVFVRPELEAAVRGLERRERAWAACRDPGALVIEEAERVRLEGVDRPLPSFRVGGWRAVIDAEDTTEAVELARTLPAADRLFRLLFGELELWRPAQVLFLRPESFEAFIDARFADPEQRKRNRTRQRVRFPDVEAVRLVTRAREQDAHAHWVVYLSLDRHVRPADTPSQRRGVWLKEGAAFLATLTLFRTARTHIYHARSSTARTFVRDFPRDRRNPESCHTWVRDHLRDGTAHRLRDVCGRSLNTLDLLASMQACAFVRFLAHLDPAGLRKLPAALEAATAPGAAERADAALKAAFGRDLDELERLWRAWMLEIG